jgi:hypothetical protein
MGRRFDKGGWKRFDSGAVGGETCGPEEEGPWQK